MAAMTKYRILVEQFEAIGGEQREVKSEYVIDASKLWYPLKYLLEIGAIAETSVGAVTIRIIPLAVIVEAK
jgi:hypothetical protein